MKITHLLSLVISLWLSACCIAQPAMHASNYKKGKLLFKDDFNKDLRHWVVETPPSPNAKVGITNNELVIDVNAGATVWLKKKLRGNIMIEYKRKVIIDSGKNDRLSDLNQFWMATDPENKNLFIRNGVFKEYDSLLLYYVGFGGNTNKTTRFRKYDGSGERVLYNDLTDKAHLLQPNKTYTIRITVYNGVTKFFVDGNEFFSFTDEQPLTEGYFGFRTTQSRQSVDDFTVYRLR
jgi:hypothetical protein